MLQNARVTAFTVSELLSENQKGGGAGGYLATQIKKRRKEGEWNNILDR